MARFDGLLNNWDHGKAIDVSPDGTHVFVTGFSFGGDPTYDWATVSHYTGATPTAAASAIGGRVTTRGGRGLRGVRIRLSGVVRSGTTTRSAVTSRNGRYGFRGLETGGLYTLTPSRAGFVFKPRSRSFSLVGQRNDLTFVAAPRRR